MFRKLICILMAFAISFSASSIGDVTSRLLPFMTAALAELNEMSETHDASNATSNDDWRDEYRLINYKYEIEKDNVFRSCFVYSDEMLMGNATKFSSDLAKASVALASAAYQASVHYTLVNEMGYSLVGGEDTYTEERTILDNDHVAYSIAQKRYGDYTIYCVPVRGTCSNEEWFSDFNLGMDNGGYHKGFHIAADEMLSELYSVFKNDGVKDPSKRIVWITGHSRGAAISNIAGAALNSSDYVELSHVFCYTFACPAVTKHRKTYQNIFNFNNKGDAITLLPMSDNPWNYYRHGRDICETVAGDSNIEKQYWRISNRNGFYSEPDGENYSTILKSLFSTEDDFFKPTQQAGVFLLCCILGDVKLTDIPEVLLAIKEQQLYGQWNLIKDLIKKSISPAQFIKGYTEDIEHVENLIHNLEEYLETVQNLDEEGFKEFKKAHRDTFDEFQNYAYCYINNADQLYSAGNIIKTALETSKKCLTAMTGLIGLYLDSNGHMKSAVFDGHTPCTYIAWINSKYCGYMGWYDNHEIKGISADQFEDVQRVNAKCFSDCDNIKKIALAEGIVAVEEDAFVSKSLKALSLPRTMKTLETGAFICNSEVFEELTMPVELDFPNAFSNQMQPKRVHFIVGSTGIMPDKTQDTPKGLYNNVELMDFEDGVVRIGDYAFDYDDWSSKYPLTKVVLPDSIETIGDYAFRGRRSLPTIHLSPNLKSIGVGCFQNTAISRLICSYSIPLSDSDVLLPESLESIPDFCFENCQSLTSIELPDGITSIGNSAFSACIKMENAKLPRSLIHLGSNAFFLCSSLTEITLPVELVSNGSFGSEEYGVPPIKHIHYIVGSTGIMPDRDEWLNHDNPVPPLPYNGTPEYTVYSTLQSVDFEEGVVRIGNKAFFNDGHDRMTDNCEVDFSVTRLSEVHLPESLMEIGDLAFAWQEKLIAVGLPSNLVSLGEGCFAGTGIRAVSVQATTNDGIPAQVLPASITTIPNSCFENCKLLQSVELAEGITNIEQKAFAVCTSLARVSLPRSVRIIASQAFEGYEGSPALEITLSEGLESIGFSCFGCSGIRSISIPSTVETIDDYCFQSCTSLSEIRFVGNAPTIGENAFYRVTANAYCPENNQSWTIGNMKDYGGNLVWNDQAETTFTLQLPRGIKRIDESSFEHIAANRIIIPSGTEIIASRAFADSVNPLDIWIPASVQMIAEDSFADSRVTIHAPAGSFALAFALTHDISTVETE